MEETSALVIPSLGAIILVILSIVTMALHERESKNGERGKSGFLLINIRIVPANTTRKWDAVPGEFQKNYLDV